MRHAIQRGNSAGSALVPVLVLAAAALVMAFAFSRSTLSVQKTNRENLADRQAFFLAEAGLNESFEALREGRAGGVGSMGAPARVGGGVLWVTSTDLGDDRRRLVATALAGSGRYALEAMVLVEPAKAPLFVATLNSDEPLTLNEGVLIDSFDSELGTYASQATNLHGTRPYAGDNGDVRSNSDVIANANAVVYGDAVPGPGHSVELNTGSYIDGSTTAAEEPFVFPEIDFPVFTSLGSFSVAASATKTLAPGNYDYDAFSIGKNGTLTVTGPATIVCDDFTGGKTANLRIDATAGPVTFYVRNSYVHTSGFNANSIGSSPMALAFLVGGTSPIVFPSAGQVRGAYYAPNTDISFASSSECWGAFAANRLSMSNDMKFHFDETLLKHWGGATEDGEDPLSVLSWRRSAVTPASLLTDRRDPLQVLGLESGLLLNPADSWSE